MAHVNRVTVDGIDLFSTYGLVFLDGYKLNLPAPKTYYADVPGGDGGIDLTDFGGDTRYDYREQTFSLWRHGLTERTAEELRTTLAGVLHGRSVKYVLGVDPGYTYTGRWTLGEPAYEGNALTIPVTVKADPYKYRDTVTLVLYARGGVDISIVNGRRRQCPVIEVNHDSVVAYKGASWELPAGSHTISDLWLDPGESVLTINTDPTYSYATWKDDASLTWADLADKTWGQVAQGDSPLMESDVWSKYADKTWADVADKTWLELFHPAERSDEYAAYVQYQREYL